MKILRATKEAQDILFTPRINASVVSLRIRGDADASDVVLPNVLTSIKNGYHVVCVVVDLQENNYYSLDITFEDELIYRDRIFVTNQDLNKFSQDVGNRDTYTYYTDNTPIENNNNRLLTSLCSSIMADNGVYEPCENDINMSIDLNGLTLFFNPRGYKEGVLYNTLPYNNTGNFTYSRSGAATRVNPSGNVETLTANVPQLDHSSGCPVYIAEPERINLITYSSDFSNPSWSKSNGAIIRPNTVISPDGTMNASTLDFSSILGSRIEDRVDSLPPGDYTFSFWAKAIDSTPVRIGSRVGFSGSQTIEMDLTQNWVRYSVTQSSSATVNAFPQIRAVNTDSSSIYIWGAQLEKGEFATSLIPTTGSVVTRGFALVTNTLSSNVLNSSEGVLGFRGKALIDNGTQRFISLNNGTTGNRVGIGFSSSGLIQVIQNSGGGTITSITYNPPTITEDSIIAIRYFNTTLEIWMNGFMVANTDTATPLPTDILTRLDFHSGGEASRFEGIINWIAYYNVLKTDEEMANLTSL